MQIAALGYVGIQTSEPGAWADFGPGVLGLGLGQRGADGSVFLRMDERAYRIAVHPGPTNGLAYLGWEVPSPTALEQAYQELEATGLSPRRGTAEECAARQVRSLVHCTDPAGTKLEFFFGQLNIHEPFQPGRPISGFVTGELGLGHVVVGVSDLEAVQRFYTDVLGFRVSDFYHERIVFLHCNARHHSIAFVQVGSVSLRHVMLEVRSLDDVGRTFDLCQTRGLVTRTLGRHPNDLMFSFYLASPSGFDIEYGWGGRLVDDTTWSVQSLSQTSVWGHATIAERSSTMLASRVAR